jgi:enterochelin esterase family protein
MTRGLAQAVLVCVVLIASGGDAAASAESLRFQLQVPAAQTVSLQTSLNDWDNPPTPMRETAPGVYSLEMPTPWTPLLQYKFIVNGQWIADPHNPNTVDDGYGGSNSVVETGFTEDPWLKPGATPLVARTLELTDWQGYPRTITLLAPRQRGCMALYFLDGQDYLQFTFVKNLLANLGAAPNLPCLAAVLIPPRDREAEDVPGSQQLAFAHWVATQVVPRAERATGAGGSVEHRLVLGPSLGGLGSVLLALAEPATFRRAASQSGSFWWKDRQILTLFAQATPAQLAGLDLAFHVGNLEADILLSANRALRDLLRAKGIPLTYEEHPSQHDWIAWRNELRLIVTRFFANP